MPEPEEVAIQWLPERGHEASMAIAQDAPGIHFGQLPDEGAIVLMPFIVDPETWQPCAVVVSRVEHHAYMKPYTVKLLLMRSRPH